MFLENRPVARKFSDPIGLVVVKGILQVSQRDVSARLGFGHQVVDYPRYLLDTGAALNIGQLARLSVEVLNELVAKTEAQPDGGQQREHPGG